MLEKRLAGEFRKQFLVAVNPVVLLATLNDAAFEIHLPFRHLGGLQSVGELFAGLVQFQPALLRLRSHGANAVQQPFEFTRIDSQNHETRRQRLEATGKPADRAARGTRERNNAIEEKQRQSDTKPELEHRVQSGSDAQKKHSERDKRRD